MGKNLSNFLFFLSIEKKTLASAAKRKRNLDMDQPMISYIKRAWRIL